MSNYFLERYSQMTGDAPDAHLEFSIRPALRVNTLKTDAKTLKKRLEDKGVALTPIPWLSDAYWYEAPFSLGATEEYLLGQYYLQDSASQLPPLALAYALLKSGHDLRGATVMDLAAAPGSKTTQLSALMDGAGTIIALEADANRIKALASNLERTGTTNVHAYVKDARHARDLGVRPDGILLDAPCSGNMAIEPGWLKRRQPTDAKSRSQLQKELLEEALATLAPGGILVYSTCSLEPEENEALLNRVLTSQRIIPCGLTIGDPGLTTFRKQSYRPDLANARRLWPHRHGTQGFFIAAIHKPA